VIYSFFELGLWWPPVPSISLQMTKFLFFNVWIIFRCVIYHIFFTHSLVVRHLGWLHNLPIMNSAMLNMCTGVSIYIDLHSFRYMPYSSIAGYKVVLFLGFWGTSILISTVAALIYISTDNR
jgi:hypothetical protein